MVKKSICAVKKYAYTLLQDRNRLATQRAEVKLLYSLFSIWNLLRGSPWIANPHGILFVIISKG